MGEHLALFLQLQLEEQFTPNVPAGHGTEHMGP